MSELERKIDSRGLMNGLLLIGFGMLFLLDRLGIADFGDLLRMYWPMMIVSSACSATINKLQESSPASRSRLIARSCSIGKKRSSDSHQVLMNNSAATRTSNAYRFTS